MDVGDCALFCLLFACSDYPTFNRRDPYPTTPRTVIAQGALRYGTELAHRRSGDCTCAAGPAGTLNKKSNKNSALTIHPAMRKASWHAFC
jgi:hypothetical protein